MQKLKNLNETEFNEKCARFLKWEFNTFKKQYFYITDPETATQYNSLEELKFHSDWNWLQKVKAKICSLKIVDEFEVKYDSVAKGFYGHISSAYKDSFGYFVTGHLAVGTDSYPTELEATTDVINQFLTWYKTHV